MAALTVAPIFAQGKVPRPAPEFVIHMPQGGHQLLSQHKGKVVLIEFLFTTCVHCQTAAKVISQLQTELGPRGFQALGVGFNDMAKMLVPDFVRDYRVNYPVGYSDRGPIHNFLGIPDGEMMHVPQMVFIDRKGVIRHQSLPRNDDKTGTQAFMKATIEKLLAEPAGAPPKTMSKRAKAPASAKKTS